MINRVTSIVILSYNTLSLLQMCIESIRGFTAPSTYELIVVDNASKDGSVDWLKKQPDIRCIYNNENMGFPKGCNQGMAIAKGTEILLLNSDVIVTPRWLEQLRTALYSDEKVGAVSCVTSCCSNLQQIDVPYDVHNIDINVLIHFAEGYNKSNSKKWLIHYRLVGFCMLFRTSLYRKIGGLDEAFTPGNFEDDDYSYRIRMSGYKLLLCSDTFIHHFGSASFIKKRTPEEEQAYVARYEALLNKNRQYFLSKWSLPSEHNLITFDSKQVNKIICAATNVLIVGYCNIYDVLKLIWDNPNKNIEYLTSAEHESRLFHNEFPLYYEKDIFHGIKKMEKKYDFVIITNTLQLDKICRNNLISYLQNSNIANRIIKVM